VRGSSSYWCNPSLLSGGKIMEEWQGEISIEKYLKEILEMIKQLNKDMAELREAVCPDVEYRFDGYREGIENKNGEEL